MNLEEVFSELNARSIKLRRNGDKIVVRSDEKVMDAELVESLRRHKEALLEHIDLSPTEWWSPPAVITPDMVPL
ncbi:hypothetical protein, partial [Streptomyces sp. 5-10]